MNYLASVYRTHHCGQLRPADIGQDARLSGWVHSYRDHGGLVFIDLRDREGLTQLVFDPDTCGPTAHEEARKLRGEWVICVSGAVTHRDENQVNPKLPTGEIEVRVKELTVLSISPTPPFTPDEHETVNEEKRLQYRYLDLRRPEMQTDAARAARSDQNDARLPGGFGFLGDRDAVSDALDAGRIARFYRAVAAGAGEFLCPAAVAAAIQATADGRRVRQIHADRALFPRRRPSCRPAGGIHAARRGDVVHRQPEHYRGHRRIAAADLETGAGR